jgi:NADH-quinone oxidoreductase subunit D
LTGVLARSAGIKRDIRLSFFETYANYYYLQIRSFIGYNSDCYDRYLIRMREMVESIHIIIQVINKINLNKKNIKLKNNFFNYLNYFSNSKIKPLKKNTQLS